MKAKEIAKSFNSEGLPLSVEPFGSGNVNDTYIVSHSGTAGHKYILQKLNLSVFPSPEAIMQNTRIVTEHFLKRTEAEKPESDRNWQIKEIITTLDGQDFLMDDDGECWRAMTLLDSSTAYEEVQGPEHAYEAGLVLGHFHRTISDIPIEKLKDTLPGFHITPSYLASLDKVLETKNGQDRLNKSEQAKQCYEFISARREWCSALEDAYARGEIKQRSIHGDPKIANIMIDNANSKGVSIIDLDTVKPGLVQYDFGDCMRSCCNPAGEEPAELDSVCFDLDLCEQITNGYMKFARDFLTDADLSYLYDSIRILTFELGLRFFADHIAGDIYFKTRRENQNLYRAAVQCRLCEKIEEAEEKIRAILP